MSDWQVGDLALCVESGRRTREGVVYTVSHILAHGERDRDGCKNLDTTHLLRFHELRPERGSWSDCLRFRKITPDKHEDCEPEFVELLKRSRVKA